MKKCNYWAIVFFVILCAIASEEGICGELRDYQLPSERQSRAQQMPMSPSSAPRIVPDSIYDDFRRDIKGLKPEQRVELERIFQKNLEKAKSDGRDDLIAYHTRLIEILKEK